MIPLELFAQAAEATGYRREALVRDYAFADVLAADGGTRSVPFTAFTQTPPSYRSAALAVVEQGAESDIETVQAYRSLGAPSLFVIAGEDVSVWQVRAGGAPRRLLPELTGVARSTVDHQRLDRVGREERGGMVRRVVGVAKRHATASNLV